MATPPPVMYPSDADNKSLEVYIDLQKQLATNLEQHRTSLEGIEGINLNIEKQLKNYVKDQRDAIQDQEKTLASIINMQKNFWKVQGTAAETNWHTQMKGLHDEMSQRGALIKMLQSKFDYEKDLAKKAHERNTRFQRLSMDILSKQFGMNIKVLSTHKSITDQITKSYGMSAKWAGVIAALVVVLQQAWETFKKFDKAAADFRIEMGLSRKETAGIRLENQKLAIELMHLGVTMDSLNKATMVLGTSMGGVYNVTSKTKEITALLAAQYKVSEEHSAGALRNMAAIAQTSMDAHTSTLAWAGALSMAAGVKMDDIMRDVATKSSATLSLMSRIPREVIKAAVEARRMNTSIDNMAKSGESLLNFTDSIQSEMEASVLLGRSINLQKARELMYNKDLVGSAKEIVRIARDVDFTNLDYFQMRAFATATGRSVDELNKMIVAEEELERARLDPKMDKTVKDYEELKKSTEAQVEAQAKNFIIQSKIRGNQDRITQLGLKWDQIMARLGEKFLPLIDDFLGLIVDNMEDIITAAAAVWVAFKFGGNILLGLGKSLVWIGELTTRFGRWAKAGLFWFSEIGFKLKGMGITILDWVKRLRVVGGIGARIGSMFSGGFLGAISKIGSVLLKFLAPIFFALNIAKEIKAILDDKKFMNEKWSIKWFGMSVLRAFGAVLKAFWTTLDDFLFGLPQKIINAIVVPFKNAFDKVKEYIPFVGGKKETSSVETKAAATYVPAVSFTTKPQETPKMPPLYTPAAMAGEQQNATVASNAKLDELIGLLKSGKINTNTYLDGQLMSATLARQTEFRGGYGVNKVG